MGQTAVTIRKIPVGAVAQRLEQGTHNPLVVGSIPTGPTRTCRRTAPSRRECRGIWGAPIGSRERGHHPNGGHHEEGWIPDREKRL
jgi:hypothetical protein